MMDAYNKVLYYYGLVGIVLNIGLIVTIAVGAATGGGIGIAKASIGLVVSIGLFFRGYRAKQQELLNHLQDEEKLSNKRS